MLRVVDSAFAIEQSIKDIRERVGSKALLALSGGVDSSVAAVLVHRAIGDQLTCVFVDTGLQRKGEVEQVLSTIRDTFGVRLVHVDAQERFLRRLDGVSDPEKKRVIIGNEFIRVFDEEAEKLGDVEYWFRGRCTRMSLRARKMQVQLLRSSLITT